MGSYKRFPVEVWNLFEELLKTRLTGIKGKLAELELGIKKVAASETADKLTTAYTIDGVEFNGTADIKHYGVCTTASNTAIKTVSCTGFKLKTGAMIMVRFDNADMSAEATQLNVNDTGARLVKYRADDLPNYAILSDSTHLFQYNGTWYEYVGSVGKIYNPFTASTNEEAGGEGLVPAPEAGKDATYFLNSQGQWVIPHDTTYNNFTSASSTNAGKAGLVPAPTVGTNNTYYLNAAGGWSIPYTVFSVSNNGLVPKPSASSANTYLCSNGTWTTPTNTTYKLFTSSNCTINGTLVPSIPANTSGKYLQSNGTWDVPTGTYVLPAATTSTRGGVIVGSNIQVRDGVISVDEVTTLTSGLMSATDKVKLDGIADYANNYTYELPTASAGTKGGIKIGQGLTITGETVTVAAATTNSIGGVKVAGVASSNISLNGANISVPLASATQAGAVKIGTNVNINSGIISVPQFSSVTAGVVPKSDNSTTKYLRADGAWIIPPNDNTVFVLEAATTNDLGGVKIPDYSGIVNTSGSISLAAATSNTIGGVKIVNNGGIANTNGNISLAAATSGTIGGVKIGTGISTGAGGVISIPSASDNTTGLMPAFDKSAMNIHFHHANTTYAKGAQVVVPGYPYFILECSSVASGTSGTTSATIPTSSFAATE